MNYLENITFRRTRTQSDSNVDNDDSRNVTSQTLDCTTNSLPDMSENEDVETLNILKNEIERLKSELQSAHKEIDELSLENGNLKQSNAELLEINKKYKVLCSSPVGNKFRTPKKNTLTNRQAKKTPTSSTLENIKKNIKNTPHITDIDTESTKKIPSLCKNSPSTYSTSLKRNMCVVSSELSNRIYSMSEGTHLRNYNMCHYRTPKCGIEYILKNLESKVRNFTSSDYCIIIIGEDDFKKTNKYIELVTLIREKLLQLNHTNFIICLPTFKYMDNSNIMFNSRIDTFNNLIYMDVQTYNYAFILDSNLNLPYTHDTYNHWYGNLNNKGFSIVISDLQDLILDLDSVNTVQTIVDCSQKEQPEITQNTSQFFL